MASLIAKIPCEGLLPVTAGGVTLTEMRIDRAFSVMPYQGQGKAVSDALSSAIGLRLPNGGSFTAKGDTIALWFGRNTTLVIGADLPADLARIAGVTDQSDGWAAVTLSGAQSGDVLARLVPIDLRSSAFGTGQTARTMLGHMNVTISRTGPDAFMILAMRSMATTLVHDLTQAMRGVAAR